MKINISTSKLIDTDDWIALMTAVGFGQASAYCSEKVPGLFKINDKTAG